MREAEDRGDIVSVNEIFDENTTGHNNRLRRSSDGVGARSQFRPTVVVV